MKTRIYATLAVEGLNVYTEYRNITQCFRPRKEVDPMSVVCWATVLDGGSAITQHRVLLVLFQYTAETLLVNT